MNGSLQAFGDGISFTQKLIQLHEGSIGGCSVLVQDLASELRERGSALSANCSSLNFGLMGATSPRITPAMVVWTPEFKIAAQKKMPTTTYREIGARRSALFSQEASR